jgi:hypothetical protein
LVALVCFIAHGPAFIPSRPSQKLAATTMSSAVAMGIAAPAFADQVGDTAKTLAEVDWNKGIVSLLQDKTPEEVNIVWQAAGKFAPLDAVKSIDSMILIGAQTDPVLGKLVASVPESAMDVMIKALWQAKRL